MRPSPLRSAAPREGQAPYNPAPQGATRHGIGWFIVSQERHPSSTSLANTSLYITTETATRRNTLLTVSVLDLAGGDSVSHGGALTIFCGFSYLAEHTSALIQHFLNRRRACEYCSRRCIYLLYKGATARMKWSRGGLLICFERIDISHLVLARGLGGGSRAA